MGDGIGEMVGNALGLNEKNPSDVEAIISQWPDRPRLGAQSMIAKYGAPQESTPEELTWLGQGPYKKIIVTKDEHHHDFPKPHMDFLEHTVDYKVPPERAAALSEYDGSCTFDRTRGELKARCDLEGHNILTLNLAHEIVTGKMTAAEARTAFSEIVTDDIKGKYPDYTTKLQFTPEGASDVKFADTPTIPGSPVRPDGIAEARGDATDGELLGFIAAADELEVVSAITAGSKKMSADAANFSQMLHEAHGAHLVETLELGTRIGVTPLETATIDAFRKKNVGALADMVPLDGEDFERDYLAAKIKGHTEMIEMIDTKLLGDARSDDVRQHVQATRDHLAAHLEQAKTLRPAMNW